MEIKTLAGFVEDLLDSAGIYGGCHAESDDAEPDQKCTGRCRCCMSAEMRSQIRDAIRNEKKLIAAGIPGDYLSQVAESGQKPAQEG